jgi:Holliday junction resolvase RusA-like endonuclease
MSEPSFFVLKDGVYTAPMASIGGTSKLSFFVKGSPISSPRPRAGRYGVYHDPKADGWKGCIHFTFTMKKRLVIGFPMAGPVELNLQFLFDRPKKDAVRFWRDAKPDLDNLEKAVMDALTEAGAWRDDAQVVRLQSIKRYALPHEEAGVHVELVSLPLAFEDGSFTSSPKS